MNSSPPDRVGPEAVPLSPSLQSDRYEQALRLAAAGHENQVRRLSGTPYLTHPVAVARIVERAGFDETTAIAALLHDLVEDTATSVAEIATQFGDEVAATVAGCSEVKLDPAGQPRPWEDRKRDHLAALRTASTATRAVVLADKLHNLISIRLDLSAGRPVWEAFHAGRDRVVWYFASVVAVCGRGDRRLEALGEACRRELNNLIELETEKPESSAGET